MERCVSLPPLQGPGVPPGRYLSQVIHLGCLSIFGLCFLLTAHCDDTG